MTPRKLTMIADFATAIAQHRGRTVPAITSFSAHCLMSPAFSGVQCANAGGCHDLSPSNSNLEIGTIGDLAPWPTRSPVRAGAPLWDGRAHVAADEDGFKKEPAQ